MRAAAAERGAIVIEALLAVLIIAAMAGALMETVASRAAATRGIAARRQALLVAESQLAAVEPRADALPATTTGTDGPFAWTVRAEPFGDDQPSAAGLLALVSVRVGRVAPAGPPLATLRTLRLAR